MKVSQINTIQPSYRARFSHADVKELVKSAKNSSTPKENFPQLYALLEYTHSLPEKTAKLYNEADSQIIKFDGKIVGKSQTGSFFEALKNACVKNKNTVQPDNHAYMSPSHFEQRAQKFKDVTADEIMTWGWF